MLAILDPRTRRGALTSMAMLTTVAAIAVLVVPAAMLRPVAAAAATAISPAPVLVPEAGTPPAPTGAEPAATNSDEPASKSSVVRQKYRCTTNDLDRKGNQTSIHADKAGTQYINKRPGRCAYAMLEGQVDFTPDLSDIASMEPGARAEFQELVPGMSRMLRVSRAANGALIREFSENGAVLPSQRASAWLAVFLHELVTNGGFAVDHRVAQLRKSGGVPAVLTEASTVRSSGVRRNYYEHLLKGTPALTTAESDRVLRNAAETLTNSGDLRAVVQRTLQYSSPSRQEVSRAIARITSDGDKSSLLRRILQDPEPADVLLAVSEAAQIDSDGDKSSVLVRGAQFALVNQDTRHAFYESAATINSDGDKRRVLITAARHSPLTSEAAGEWLGVVRGIESDADKSSALITAIRAGLVLDASVRPQLESVIRTIDSDADRGRVMNALLRAGT